MYVVTVAEGSDLVGVPVDGLDVTVVAVKGGDDGIDTLARDRTLAAGDEVYLVSRPDAYRRLESRGRPPETQSS
jgi:Trk K+ transport system NAD-binding subunit